MMKLKIGEFARLAQISIQTLRYYDELGLLKPADVDIFNNYRYYTLEQLPRLVQILAFKDLGFSLDQITRLLEEKLGNDELRRLLSIKQQEMHQQLQDQLDRLERINARLRWIDEECTPPACEVILKRIEPIRIVSVSGSIPTYWDSGSLWGQLLELLNRYQILPQGPWFTICHASEPEIDVEVCAPLLPGQEGNHNIPSRTLAGVENMACTIHHGPFTGLNTAFTGLMRWIDANGFSVAGPDREVYLRLPEHGQYHTDQNAITELQIPVQRKRDTNEF